VITVLPSRLEGVKYLVREAQADARGSFRRIYSQTEYAAAGISETFVEDNVSISSAGVLRGMHYDFRLAKFVQVLVGEVFDVLVDVRTQSPQFGEWEAFRLSAQGCEQLLVPRGFAHGFYVLSPTAVVSYKQTAAYDPAAEGQVLWCDPAVGIEWPLAATPTLSAKDAAAPTLRVALRR
jgi:dTDP-4-dehydrorhamnose 3,5-epimerase